VPASRRAQLPAARLLFARGLTLEQIARQLACSSSTLYRWKLRDEKGGLSWGTLRDKTPAGGSLVAGLENLLAALVNGDGDPIARARAIADLHSILQRERVYELELHGVGRFIAWSASSLSSDEHATIVGGAAKYLDQVRSALAAGASHV
jgi:transposase-like protein